MNEERPEATPSPTVRWVRLGALFGGMAALALAMIVFQDQPRARDWSWTIGVALLVLSLVANRLIPKSR